MICNTPIQGRYKLKVYRPDGSVRLETPWFDNLITNNGMNQIATLTTLAVQCYIGRSGTTPTINDTQLGSIIATSNSVSVTTFTFYDSEEPYWRAYKVFTFNAGNATGDVREVACGVSSTNLFSRSLIQGVQEIPATITVLADEKLEVYYERRNYVSRLDRIVPFLLSGVSYEATIRASNIGLIPNIFSGFGAGLSGVSFSISGQKFLDTIYVPISGAASGANLFTVAPYITNSHYFDYVAQFDGAAANYSGGIGTGTFQTTQSRFKFLFTPYIPKAVGYRLRFNIRHSWSRYVPAL